MTGATETAAEDSERVERRTIPGFDTLLALHRELLLASRRYRWTRWAVALVVAVYGLRLLRDEAGLAALHSAMTWLAWLGVLMCLAFFAVPPQSHRALGDLARLSGLEPQADQGAIHLARLSLPLKPLLLGTSVLWICVAWNRRDVETIPTLALAALGCCASVAALCGALVLLAALCERVTPKRPVFTLSLLVVLPALLVSAIPELPSLVHAYGDWTRASIELLELR